MTQIIDGRAVSATLKEQMRQEVAAMARKPQLVAVLVGNDGGSQTYVAAKAKMCDEIGFRSQVLRYDDKITQSELLEVVATLNADDEVDGFIVQLPLPRHIDEQAVIAAIDPDKDVDGFHPVNVGRMALGMESLVSATPLGILELLKFYNIETKGKNCVVIGRSNIVGRPISNLLSAKGWDCTVTVCHSRTKDLAQICRRADIIIAALGSPEFVTADMVAPGAVVIDVGTTRVPAADTKSGFRLKGDVLFDEVAPLCSWITPVPGGVGPMTIISLMKNTLQAAKAKQSRVK